MRFKGRLAHYDEIQKLYEFSHGINRINTSVWRWLEIPDFHFD